MENNIIVFFDYNCPFCYISFNIIEELKHQYNINCIYKPCELYPEIKSSGALKEDCSHGYDVEDIYRKLRILGNRNNIQFGSLDKKYNSHKSLLLAEFAQSNNKIIEFSKAIYEEYYKSDKNISDDLLLRNIFNKLNLDYDLALEQIHDGTLDQKLNENMNLKSELNIDIFPTYIINDDNILQGILSKRSFRKVFES